MIGMLHSFIGEHVMNNSGVGFYFARFECYYIAWNCKDSYVTNDDNNNIISSNSNSGSTLFWKELISA